MLGEGGEVLILLEKIKHILQVLLIEHFHWALDIAVGSHSHIGGLTYSFAFGDLMLVKDKAGHHPSLAPLCASNNLKVGEGDLLGTLEI